MRHTYRGDPYWTRARFNSSCCKCKKLIRKGKEIFYYPKGKYVFCGDCGQVESARFETMAADEAVYCGGY